MLESNPSGNTRPNSSRRYRLGAALWVPPRAAGEAGRVVQVGDQAWEQLRNVASLPFLHQHVAAMPDVHWGLRATVGSVIPTRGTIIPAAVGVDLGCGMMAVPTGLRAEDLPDTLAGVRSEIETCVPRGRTD